MAVAHNVYALVNNGVVQNLAVGNYYDCSVVAHNTYGNEAVAIEVTQYPVEIGDTYEGEKFYRVIQGTKTEIERIPTEEEVVAAHTATLSEHSDAIDELIIAITPTEVN